MPRNVAPNEAADFYIDSFEEPIYAPYFRPLEAMKKGLESALSKKDENGDPWPYELSEEETELATAVIDASDGLSDLAKQAYDAKEAGNQAEYERLRAQLANKYQSIDTNLTALQGESGSRRYRQIFGKATATYDRTFERKSAARHIEDIQAEIRKTGKVTDEQLAMLIAARQMSNAVRNDRRNLDAAQLTGYQLLARSEKLLRDGQFGNFIRDYRRQYDVKDLTDGHGGKLEDKLDAWAKDILKRESADVLNSGIFGRYKFKKAAEMKAYPMPAEKQKSALEVIEEVQKKIRSGATPTAEDVATIFAARTLADATRRSKGKLEKTMIDPKELERVKTRFEYDQAFGLFADKLINSKNVSKLTDGHGGAVEEVFTDYLRDYVKDHADKKNDLNPEIFGRYQVFAGLKTRKEYDAEMVEIRRANARRKAEEARREAGKRQAGKKAAKDGYDKELYKDEPVEKQEEEEPEKANTTDDLEKGHNLFDRFEKIDPEDIEPDEDAPQTDEKAYQRPTGFDLDKDLEARPDRLSGGFGAWFHASSRDYAAGKVPSAKSLLHPGKKQTQLEHAAFMAAASHLSRKYPNAELDEEQLKKTAARYYKDPVFQFVMRDKPTIDAICSGKADTLAEKVDSVRSDFSDVLGNGREVFSQPFNTAYDRLTKRDADIQADKAQTWIRSETERLLDEGAPNRGAAEKEAQKNYLEKLKQEELSKRGPKFKKMVEAVDAAKSKQAPDAGDLIRAVNSIIDYQTGKEKGFSSADKNQRFDDSMRMLGELTAGTDAEKYFQQQLDKVNQARGLQPEDPNYLKPEDFVQPKPEPEPELEVDEPIAFPKKGEPEGQEKKNPDDEYETLFI